MHITSDLSVFRFPVIPRTIGYLLVPNIQCMLMSPVDTPIRSNMNIISMLIVGPALQDLSKAGKTSNQYLKSKRSIFYQCLRPFQDNQILEQVKFWSIPTFGPHCSLESLLIGNLLTCPNSSKTKELW